MATLVRYNPTPVFFDPFFGTRVVGRPVINRYRNTLTNQPAANVKETETAFHLALAVPGLKKDNLKISVENNTLTVAYQPEAQTAEKAGNSAHYEFGVQAFERRFRLPKTVNPDAITAAYTDGILALELPKVEEQKVVKEITIA
ncbi:Hsp20/alpha crystallin family protein [Spirosoma montaniterrae]|uniref:Heat-shock protein n=1 Tax=Spirosoma montaniterrae TaxID=1178516 RepID=A0A1P9WY33_9BACT|nr:Hsp20/alpha crystallin family protein [Spirosoma montaniterrae]AQG80297.1 heat-shock protein [Spirosoma montaniterrae]